MVCMWCCLHTLMCLFHFDYHEYIIWQTIWPQKNIHKQTFTHTYTHIHTLTHIHTFTHSHTFTHTFTHSLTRLCSTLLPLCMLATWALMCKRPICTRSLAPLVLLLQCVCAVTQCLADRLGMRTWTSPMWSTPRRQSTPSMPRRWSIVPCVLCSLNATLLCAGKLCLLLGCVSCIVCIVCLVYSVYSVSRVKCV